MGEEEEVRVGEGEEGEGWGKERRVRGGGRRGG